MKHNQGFLKLVEEARQHIRECTIEQVKGKLDRHEPFEFIDVREDNEYAQDHARDATHLGRGVLERDVETMIPNKQLRLSSIVAAAIGLSVCSCGEQSSADGIFQRRIDDGVVSRPGGMPAIR
jgi:rhodanese-related sulfurtransferase